VDRRKILLIFVAAWVSAALLTWFLYASTRTPRAEKTVAVQAAARDLPAGTRLQKADLKTVRFREADVPKTALLEESQAVDRPLLVAVGANEPITSVKIGGIGGADGLPGSIEIGKRAISVPVNDTSGVSGLIQPRAHVDVLFTRPGNITEAVTTTILEDVVVLAIGRNTEVMSASAAAAQNAQNTNRTAAQAATLLVTPEQARKLELAKNQGKISLALRNPLDHDQSSTQGSTTSEALYARPPVKTEIRKPPPEPVKIEPPKPVVMEKKEPPPPAPKKIVEVFHGDKRVDESFQP
jgi:pilus assembly protein CpaB